MSACDPGDAPIFPQPPAKALAVPTTLGENMMELQNWQHTKHARPKPMQQRTMMKPVLPVTMLMRNTARSEEQQVGCRQCS